MKAYYPKEYRFFPSTFILPTGAVQTNESARVATRVAAAAILLFSLFTGSAPSSVNDGTCNGEKSSVIRMV